MVFEGWFRTIDMQSKQPRVLKRSYSAYDARVPLIADREAVETNIGLFKARKS